MANFAKISQAAKVHSGYQDATKDKYEIKDVRIVPGSSLNRYWKNAMQVITTDKGEFIDKLPINSGHDWQQEIGKMVTAKVTTDKSNNKWLNWCGRDGKVEAILPASVKEDLPPGYDINDNPQLKQAYDYIRQDVPVIFLTGGAGTGKSTFIKYLKTNLRADMGKACVVLAFTGVAAANVGGQTIHSFFNFKFDPFEHKEIKSSMKNDVIDHTDVIIIDEISMVHSWLLDHIDYALRLWCDKNKPFGGKQMVLIGDCFQLPPVVNDKDEEAKKFFAKWDDPFFFAAKVFESVNAKAVQLEKIYRQKDERFVHILNRIRNCDNGYEKDVEFLNKNCLLETRFKTKKVPEECLLLTTKNNDAENFNKSKLDIFCKKGVQAKKFKAFNDNFNTKHFLTPDMFEVCIGAKVMVTKNIAAKNLVNGDMGIVVGFGGTGNSKEEDYVAVKIKGSVCRLERETWQGIKYRWNDDTKTIEQWQSGSFCQIPLTLGWAVTIHKSQGLTLDSVAIDAADAWDSGQVYVALSRARTLNGIVLRKSIPHNAVKVNTYIKRVYESLFPEQKKHELNPEEDHKHIIISNEGFTMDVSEEKTHVIIGGVDFDLYPNETQGEKIGAFVRRTLPILLEKNLIPDAEMKKLLNDEEYCYNTFGIITKTGFKYKLLGKNKQEFYDARHNQYKCWLKEFPKSGYYICSQWWKTPCTEKFAQWLIDLSEGKLVASSVQTCDDSYTEEGVDWAKKRKEEKDKNLAAYLKQQEEVRKKQNIILSPISNKETETIKSHTTRKEEKPIEILEGKRTPLMQDGYVKFILADGSFILANDKGMKNSSLPWTDKMLRLKVFKKNEKNILTEWGWEEA